MARLVCLRYCKTLQSSYNEHMAVDILNSQRLAEIREAYQTSESTKRIWDKDELLKSAQMVQAREEGLPSNIGYNEYLVLVQRVHEDESLR